MGIPQHRPSTAPLPEPPKEAVRPLTEQERILARVQYPNHEDPEGEYRRMQSIEEDEVVEPGFSKEGW